MDILAMVQFVLAGIVALRDTSKSFGVHSRYSRLGAAFQAQFGVPLYTVERDAKGKYAGLTGPLAAMVESGKIAIRPVTGGYMLYDAAERSAALEAARGRRQEADTRLAANLAAKIAASIPAASGKRSGARQ